MGYRINALENWQQAVATLLAEMAADPNGMFSLSVYETGRLVRHAPSLPGHVGRLRFLLDAQQEDGGWGGSNEYGLLPTLSAIDALLYVIPHSPPADQVAAYRDEVASSISRGLSGLFGQLSANQWTRLPDTVAVEILVPSLIEQLNESLN